MDHFVEFMKEKHKWRIVPREVWGALPPRSEEPLNHPVSFVRITYTKTEPCKKKVTCSNILQKLQTHQMNDLQLPDIVCNFLIGVEGSVYIGRGWNNDSYIPGVHDPRLKGNCIHIGYIGDYKVLKPPGNAEQSTCKLINYGQTFKYIERRANLVYFKKTDGVWWNRKEDAM